MKLRIVLTSLFLIGSFMLGTYFPRHAVAAQTIRVEFLPPTDAYGATTRLTSGYGHGDTPDPTALDWQSKDAVAGSSCGDCNLYVRYRGYSDDTAPKTRALFQLYQGTWGNCGNVLDLDLYSAETGAFLATVQYVHATNIATWWGAIRFKSGGELQSGISIAQMLWPDNSCTSTGWHVHERNNPSSYVAIQPGGHAYYCPQDCACDGCYISVVNSGDYTRKVTWTIQNNANQNHRLVVAHSGKCLQPYLNDTANGTQVVQYTCSNSNLNQQVAVRDMFNGYYTVIFLQAGKCLEVLGFNTSYGAPLGIWDCWGGSNQDWSGPFVSGTQYFPHYSRFMAEVSGNLTCPSGGPGYMEIYGQSISNNAALVQWCWWDGPNQIFRKY